MDKSARIQEIINDLKGITNHLGPSEGFSNAGAGLPTEMLKHKKAEWTPTSEWSTNLWDLIQERNQKAMAKIIHRVAVDFSRTVDSFEKCNNSSKTVSSNNCSGIKGWGFQNLHRDVSTRLFQK